MTDVSITLRPLKTAMFVPLRGVQNFISIQGSMNLGDTRLQITRECETAET